MNTLPLAILLLLLVSFSFQKLLVISESEDDDIVQVSHLDTTTGDFQILNKINGSEYGRLVTAGSALAYDAQNSVVYVATENSVHFPYNLKFLNASSGALLRPRQVVHTDSQVTNLFFHPDSNKLFATVANPEAAPFTKYSLVEVNKEDGGYDDVLVEDLGSRWISYSGISTGCQEGGKFFFVLNHKVSWGAGETNLIVADIKTKKIVGNATASLEKFEIENIGLYEHQHKLFATIFEKSTSTFQLVEYEHEKEAGGIVRVVAVLDKIFPAKAITGAAIDKENGIYYVIAGRETADYQHGGKAIIAVPLDNPSKAQVYETKGEFGIKGIVAL